MPSRSQLIADLKRQRVGGSLSKMNKHQLVDLQRAQEVAGRDDDSALEITAGAAVSQTPLRGGGISIAGMEMPEQPRVSGGGGGGGPSPYRAFVAARMKENGGDMRAAAAAWRSRDDQEGGHFFRMNGTAKAAPQSKHRHRGKPFAIKKKAPAIKKKAPAPAPARVRGPQPQGGDDQDPGGAMDGGGMTVAAMAGGAYWDAHAFTGGSWWHDAWDTVGNVGQAVADLAPEAAGIPLLGPEVAAAAEVAGRVAQGVGAVGSAFTGGGHSYKDFMAARMKENGGDMRAAAAAWRAQ